MVRFLTVGLFAVLMASASPAAAQIARGGGGDILTEADITTITDRRIELVQAALQLTPDQAKLWPAVEQAIRARGDWRRARLVELVKRQANPRERTPIELLRDRSEVLAQRSALLKKLADAWAPLYQTLDEKQKMRLRILAVLALREMRDAVESRRMEAMDAEEDDE